MILTGARSGTTVSRQALQEELAHYTRDGGRVVVAGDDDLPFDTAVVPRRRAAAALVEHLSRLGYRRPALVRPDHDSAATREWEDGVVATARALGMRLEQGMVIRAPMTRDGGYAAVRRLIEARPEDLDVILATTDAMAIGVMSAMRDAGMEPGREIGVAGCDDVAGAADMTPALTSVNLALAEVGAAAVRLALETPAAERRIVSFEPRVVLRGTTPGRP
jgi:LacI family transcriptional regulator